MNIKALTVTASMLVAVATVLIVAPLHSAQNTLRYRGPAHANPLRKVITAVAVSATAAALLTGATADAANTPPANKAHHGQTYNYCGNWGRETKHIKDGKTFVSCQLHAISLPDPAKIDTQGIQQIHGPTRQRMTTNPADASKSCCHDCLALCCPCSTVKLGTDVSMRNKLKDDLTKKDLIKKIEALKQASNRPGETICAYTVLLASTVVCGWMCAGLCPIAANPLYGEENYQTRIKAAQAQRQCKAKKTKL